MNLSAPFILRPVATVLLSLGLALAGLAAFFVLPVSPLPQVDFPYLSVSASLPGASPEVMARSVTAPLERRLGTISGVTEMSSSSSAGSSRVTLQFELDRDINGAAREVQAALNAARSDLPSTLRGNPSVRKMNPADSPVIILALTSRTRTPGQIYDAVASIVSQRVAQVPGVGDVEIGGGSLPAVRVELQPLALNRLGLSSAEVRAALQAANAQRPQGDLSDGSTRWQILVPPPGRRASDFASLVVAWRDGAPVRLSDVALVRDGVENSRTLGLFNGQPAVVVLVTRQPGANIIETVDAVQALLPELRAQLPQDIELQVASERTHSIRTALREVELTLMISIALVVVVVGLFLGSLRAALVPAVAAVVSLLATFAAMQAFGFSLNNLTLMALTVATGFVVDDAIVVMENIARHREAGLSRQAAALQGARDIGFTVLAISVSLVAVFIPLLFMQGQVGRLFREFAVTLSTAVGLSLVLSLTTTPMMCAWLLKRGGVSATAGARPRLARFGAALWQRVLKAYAWGLDLSLAHRAAVMLVLAGVTALNAWLFVQAPKGFFPEQDSGQIFAGLRADRSISTQAMGQKLQQVVDIIRADPAVATVVGFTGGGRAGGGFMFLNLKPLSERREGGQAVIARLRPQLARVSGLRVFLNPTQDLRMGGRSTSSTWQYALKAESLDELRTWSRRLADALKQDPRLTDVDTDDEEHSVETRVLVDADTAARLGVRATDIDNALFDAFGQRAVSTLYGDVTQYKLIMEWAPGFIQGPAALNDVQVPARDLSTAGTSANPGLRDASTAAALSTTPTTMVPLSAFARVVEGPAPTSIQREAGENTTTLSFNLAPGTSLGEARAIVAEAEARIALPTRLHGSFAGTARSFEQTQGQQLILILAALAVIYIVLGVLYESLVHPLTVLSTLPAAGVGAVMALLLMRMDLSIMALIGLFLLIGIVKKNAILIIDLALVAERERGLDPAAAVREACLLRLRPILMTTLAAGLGAVPLAVGFGEGAELRQALGITILGGLVASQALTLFSTPVVYVLLDGLRRRRATNAAPVPRHPATVRPDAAR